MAVLLGGRGIVVALAQVLTSPLIHSAEDRFDVEHRSAVDRFEVADFDRVLLHVFDHDGVQSYRVGTVGRPCREHAFGAPIHVAAWVYGEDVAAPLVQPGQHDLSAVIPPSQPAEVDKSDRSIYGPLYAARRPGEPDPWH